MTAISELKVDFLENAARSFARNKADDVGGELVDIALNYSGASVQDLNQIQQAEVQIKRRIEALLKNALVEFTRMWTAELERQAEASRKLIADSLATTLNPPIIRG